MRQMQKKNKVTINIPKRWRGDDERFIACNGRRVLVKTGVDVEVAPEIAEVYFNSVSQRDESERKISEYSSAV
ncbi:MAG: hypothetical protein IJS45_05965 [Clostridia bacterium]|nr:hypothetical protein [Clostridia bacterium]